MMFNTPIRVIFWLEKVKTKGHLISKHSCGIFRSPKNKEISALASKKRSNQTNYYYTNQELFNIIKRLYFFIQPLLKSADLRDVAIQKKSNFQE